MLFFFVIILVTILSTSVSFSQEVKDRNGNGIIEESDYWTTSDKYSEKYIKDYNAKLEKRASQYNRTLETQNTFNVQSAIGSKWRYLRKTLALLFSRKKIDIVFCTHIH